MLWTDEGIERDRLLCNGLLDLIGLELGARSRVHACHVCRVRWGGLEPILRCIFLKWADRK